MMLILNFIIQVSSVVVLTAFSVGEAEVRVDDLGFVYLIDDHDLLKKNQKGEDQFVYSRLDLGIPAQLDLSDPLRPLLLYPETGALVVLDNTLSEQRMVRLWDVNLGLPLWVASGIDEHVWVYDGLNQEVIRLNEKFVRQVSTGYLPSITGSTIDFLGMAERHEQLFIADRNYGVWVFDRFGTLVKRIPMKGISKFSSHADGMYILADQKGYLLSYHEIFPKELKLDGGLMPEDVLRRKAFFVKDGVLEICSIVN